MNTYESALEQYATLLAEHNRMLKKQNDLMDELIAARAELTEVKDLTLTYVSEELEKLYTAICEDTNQEFIKMCEEIYGDNSLSVFRKFAALDRLYGSHLRQSEQKEVMSRLKRSREEYERELELQEAYREGTKDGYEEAYAEIQNKNTLQ